MAQEVRARFARECYVLPFMPGAGVGFAAGGSPHDFVYVASGEPHKNHRRLVSAWEHLAERNLYPSLCLTLDCQRDAGLLQWINQRSKIYGLNITNQLVPPERIAELYAQSRALVYPSLFESFGLPLLEAQAAGLPIIAAERDYIRDVVAPEHSFDPESSLSIARAVMRYLAPATVPIEPPDAHTFLQQLEQIS